MLKDSNIVEDIRRIRHKISAKFDHDIDRYIDYLQSEAFSRDVKRNLQNFSKKKETLRSTCTSEMRPSVREGRGQKRKETGVRKRS